jgi:peptidoglycan hydrolase-like protein with peptidoglycan-binding domain
MKVLNFSHPLNEKQHRQIVQILGEEPESIRTVKVHFDVTTDFTPQVVQLVDDLGITPEEWQTQTWLIALPSLNYAAGVLLAELHGRMGHFPAILRLRSVPNAVVTEYEVAEIINLEAVRQAAQPRFQIYYVTHEMGDQVVLGIYPCTTTGAGRALEAAMEFSADDGVLWVEAPDGRTARWGDVVEDPTSPWDLMEWLGIE